MGHDAMNQHPNQEREVLLGWPSPELEEAALAWCAIVRPLPSQLRRLRALAHAAPEALSLVLERACLDPDLAPSIFELQRLTSIEAGREIVISLPFDQRHAAVAACFFVFADPQRRAA
jgi:hypothetical protein